MEWGCLTAHTPPAEVLIPHGNAPLIPTGRLRLARCIVEDGWPLRRAADRFLVSVTTAKRSAGRCREHRQAGMHDRSSCLPLRWGSCTRAPNGGSSGCGSPGGGVQRGSPAGWVCIPRRCTNWFNEDGSRRWTTWHPPSTSRRTTVRSTPDSSRCRENPPSTEPGAVQCAPQLRNSGNTEAPKEDRPLPGPARSSQADRRRAQQPTRPSPGKEDCPRGLHGRPRCVARLETTAAGGQFSLAVDASTAERIHHLPSRPTLNQSEKPNSPALSAVRSASHSSAS